LLVNALISQWLLNLLIIAIWTWSSIRLCFSYRSARTQEKEQQQQREREQQEQQQEQHKQEGAAVAAGPATFELVICCDPDMTVAQGLSFKAISSRVLSCCSAAMSRLSSWASYQPWWTISAIGLLFGLFIAGQVIQGRLTPMCSASYWAITGLLCGVGLAAAAGVSVWLLRAEARKSRDTQPAAATNTLPTTTITPAAAAAAGGQPASCHDTAAGQKVDVLQQPSQQPVSGSVVCWTRGMLAGIHIQMVIADLMLGAWPLSPIILAISGMHPQVGAGTSKLMLFMITAGAGLSFIAAGSINMSYLLVYGLINAVATPLGVWVVDWAIKRTGRPSCIIMLTIVRLMACVVLQAALQAVPSLIALAHGLPRAGFMAQPLCQHKH